jgi:hypothetical protein
VAIKDAFTIGIEEEYFLVDAATKQVMRDMPKTFLDIAKAATNGQAMGEFLQSQCEVATLPHHDIHPPTPSFGICARPWRRSRPITVSPSSPPAPTRPPTGAARSSRRASATTW